MISKPITIHPVLPEDLDALCQLSRQTFSEAFGAANDPQPFQAYLDHAFSKEQLKEELAHPFSQFFFAEMDGEPLGYMKLVAGKQANGIQGEKVLEIQRIYVRQEYHGMGVGKILMEKALEVAEHNQAEYLWLGVWELNPKAIAFYEKWGFKPIGSQEFKLGDEIQKDIVMKKDLFP